jgi:hypothetical protein
MRSLLPAILLFANVAVAQVPVLAAWPFDVSAGSTVIDIGPNANHGSLVNFGGAPYATGRFGNALVFDGVDDYVSVPASQSLPLYRGNGAPYSICFWVKAPAQDDRRIYAEGNSAVGSQQLFSLGSGRSTDGAGANSKLRHYLRNDAGLEVAKTISAATVFDDTWHHVAFVDVAGNAVLYVDGVVDTRSFDYRVRGGLTTSSNGTNQSTYGTYSFDRVSLGAVLRSNAVAFLAGTIDEVWLFGSALSAADVQGLMAATAPAVCATSAGTFGVGCGAAPLDVQIGGSLALGQTLTLQYAGGTAGAFGFLLVNFGSVQPLDLTPLGFTGCKVYVPSPVINGLGVVSANPLTVGLSVPNASMFMCMPILFQAVALGSGLELSRVVVGQVGI